MKVKKEYRFTGDELIEILMQHLMREGQLGTKDVGACMLSLDRTLRDGPEFVFSVDVDVDDIDLTDDTKETHDDNIYGKMH